MFKLTKFIKRFGFFEGVKLFQKFRYGNTSELKISFLKYPIYMKPNSIDNCSFQEIFLDEEYEFNFPNFGKKEITVIDNSNRT